MTTQTQKSPGRPKKTQEKPKRVEVQPERLEKFKGTSIRGELDDTPIKKTFIKRKEKVQQHKEYEVIKGGGIVFMLPQKGVTVYDEEKNTVREIRYCPNEPSIWTDEQGKGYTQVCYF